jgi:hypothetical protein
MILIEIPWRAGNSKLHSTATSEKVGDFYPDCRILVSRRTNYDPHVSASLEEIEGKL